MSEKQLRFVKLLKDMFELEKSDLDFGIYRIMNIREKEISSFLENTLASEVNSVLSKYATDNSQAKNRISEIEKQCEEMGVKVETTKLREEYEQYKIQLSSGTGITELESDVYSALYNFFSRYYDKGDFISKRRYKEGVYAIPYEGEEVKLYWANHDQYYIKTSENFKDYSFNVDVQGVKYTFHFKLVDVNIELNNNKESDDKKREFILLNEDFLEYEGNELTLKFEYRIPTNEDKDNKLKENSKINKSALEKIRIAISEDKELKGFVFAINMPAMTEKNKNRTVLEKHIETYVAKNTFDYFIHKDLLGFLNRELDFFIKSEIMNLDDLDTENEIKISSYIAKVKAIKKIGRIIIRFLSQIEEFQKKLWLKKKFVVETNWCITLDKVDESFYEEIITNKLQIQEWIDMYAINEIEASIGTSGYSDPLTIDFLRQNTNLVVDTKHFSSSYKERLIASIDDLDEQTSGLMIHGDNFQGLNLLERTYKNSIRLIYIDPPYNTDASKILYKNGYEHSSWLSLMHSRLEMGKRLMSQKGIIELAIDDYEFRYINSCMDEVFGIGNAISNIAIFTNPKGRDQGYIAQAHDYTIMYAKNKKFAETNNFILSEAEVLKKFSKIKDNEAVRELPLKRTGSGKRREERPYMYFPFIYDSKSNLLNVIPEEEYTQIYNPDTDSFDDDFVEKLREKYSSQDKEYMLPISVKGEKLRWRWGYTSCKGGAESGVLFAKAMRKGGYAVYQYDTADNEATPKSLWVGEKYDASSKGTNLLEDIIPSNPFDYPKSIYTVEDNVLIGSNNGDVVLDFFAGSGTTGHAVINLNRESDDIARKYILIEMGEYFNTVTKPRIKKVIYAADWKNGKPVNRNTSVSQIFKYIKLENYEDSLNNIELFRSAEQEQQISLDAKLLNEYLVSYMLDIESMDSILNIDRFKEPFGYNMKITEGNEVKETNIDLVETFNYLIGIKVLSQGNINKYNAKPVSDGDYENQVSLIEDVNGKFSFKKVEGMLQNGKNAMIIWRNLTSDLTEDNSALDAFFKEYVLKNGSNDYDIIFVNGDNNLLNLRSDKQQWKVKLIELEFKKTMFEEV